MDMTIRRLRESDAAELERMDAESFSRPWPAREFAALTERDYCLYLVAEFKGEVIGCCGLTNSFGEGSIDKVVVRGGYRGRGIASRMMEALLQAGEEKGITAFTLEVRVGNAAAIRLYEKFGFISEGIRPRFYEHPTEDAMIMWRRQTQSAGRFTTSK